MNFLKVVSLLIFFAFSIVKTNAQSPDVRIMQPNVLIVQPIVVAGDDGSMPASMALPEYLVDKAYLKAGVDFLFLEPIYYNNSKARDGLINLDEIVQIAHKEKLLKGTGDIANMLFVNAVDGNKGPLGRGMMGGNITFIALGDNNERDERELLAMQAFVIAHEVGHNLSLQHAVDDENVPDSIPNIMGDGEFVDRIDPEYSLNEYQIKTILRSPLVHPRIDLLSKEQGQLAILDESFEPYFSNLQNLEISAFIGENVPYNTVDENQAFAKEKFASAVIDFTKEEKECIEFVATEVNKILMKYKLTMMANHPWRFIKVEDWLCGGFAHTRGTYIILSQKHIDNLSKGWSNNMTLDEKKMLIVNFGSLLVHEQMHSLQRVFKSKFVKLYTEYWNFIQTDIAPEESIVLYQVSNPDAPIAEWVFPNPRGNKSYYWVRTLLKDISGIPVMGKDFVDKVYHLEKIKDSFIVMKGDTGNLLYSSIDEMEFYKTSFPVSRGLDHPNEISAYMFADYFKALVLAEKPFKDAHPNAQGNIDLFIDWIKKEMVQ